MRILLLSLLFACGPKVSLPEPVYGPSWPTAKKALRTEAIAVAKPMTAADLPAPPLAEGPPPDSVSQMVQDVAENLPDPTYLDPLNPRDASFLRNDWVGNIRFGGGFVRLGSVGVEVRARLVELNQEEEYEQQSLLWIDRAVKASLQKRKQPALTVEGLTDLEPVREKVRGRHPDDEHDNLNVPRTQVSPPVLSADQRKAARERSEGRRWLLVPIVRNYYSHNAGWFLGQDYGCMSGARAEVLITLYDLDTGEPAWWLKTEAKTIERTGSPTRTDLDAYLLEVEEQTQKQLDKWLLR